jgi:hypothetical protein
MPETLERARQLITSRLAELDTETQELEGALGALGTGGRGSGSRASRASSTRKKPGRPPKAKSARAPKGQRREELFAALKANPGARPAELARTLSIKPTQVHALLAKARAEKLVIKRDKGYALKG